jgi:hypothetical protein
LAFYCNANNAQTKVQFCFSCAFHFLHFKAIISCALTPSMPIKQKLSLRNQLPHAEYFSQYDCAGGATCNKSRKQPREFRTELRKIGWSKTPRWLWPPPGSEGVPGNIFCVSLSEWKFMLFPGNRTHLKPGKSVWSFLSVFVTKEHRCVLVEELATMIFKMFVIYIPSQRNRYDLWFSFFILLNMLMPDICLQVIFLLNPWAFENNKN